MSDQIKGPVCSGITYRSILGSLRDNLTQQYGEALTKLRVKGKDRDARIAAHRDGMCAILLHLKEMGVIAVVED